MKNEWKTEPLGVLCEFQRGLTYAKSDEVDFSDNVVLRATNIDLATNLLIFDELKYINDKVVVPENRKVKKDSLMICTASGSKSHLGKVAFIDDDYGYAFGGFMGMLTPKNVLYPKYLFHLMTSNAYKDFINELSDGANINNLKFDDLQRFQIPYPTLPEQHRIVGILDEAFENIASAKANAEQNLKNVRALFESHLQAVFTQRGDGWVDCNLDKIATNCDNQRIPITKSDRKSGEYRYYGASGVVDYVAGYIFDGDYLLISEDGANLLARSTPIAFSVSGKFWVNNHAHILQFKNMETQKYVEFYLESIKLDEFITGAAQPKLNQNMLNSIPIPMPLDIMKQSAIVEAIEILGAETQRLESIYKQKIAALDELKKALLHKAFAGEL